MARILVTTGAWNAALCCLESLSAKGHSVDVLTSAKLTPINFSRRTNRTIAVPPESEPEAWRARLMEILRAEDYDLLVPISDVAVNIVSEQRAEIEPLVRVIIPSADMIALASDKARSTQMAAKLGVRIPESRYPEDEVGFRAAFAELGLPCVVKVPISTASAGVLISSDPDQLLAFAAQYTDPANRPFCQEFIAGDLVGAAVLAHRGDVVASHLFAVDPEYLVGGNPPYARECVDPQITADVAAIIKALDWSGPIDFDFLRDTDGNCRFLETNPRFSGTISFAAAAGVDFPAMLIDLAQGHKVDCNYTGLEGRTYRSGMEQELFWWLGAPMARFTTLVSQWLRKDVLHKPRLSDPGLVGAQILSALRKTV